MDQAYDRLLSLLVVCIVSFSALPTTGYGMASADPAPGPIEVLTCRTADEADTTGEVERRSPGRALLYSLGGTVVLAPVLGAGLIVGPAFGHCYANNHLRASIGAGARGLAAGAVLIGMIGTTTEAITDPDVWSGSGDGEVIENRTNVRIAAVGLGVLMASALVDIVMAPFAAQDYNEDQGLAVKVRPTTGPGADQVGVALQVQL